MTPFDRLASRYDEWYERPFGRTAYGLELMCLRELAGKFERGLEIGVGTGRFASSMGIRFGLDPSLGMLSLAKERGVLVVQGVGEALPFRESSFDLVLMVATLCFVKEPVKVLEESRRVLGKGGKLLLGLVLRESRWAEFYLEKARSGHPIYKHAEFYTFEAVESMLSRAGFAIERVMSTILEEPQDTEPVKNRSVEEGFSELAGFTCVVAT